MIKASATRFSQQIHKKEFFKLVVVLIFDRNIVNFGGLKTHLR